MDYPSFLELHELLKDGIEEYVRKEGTTTNRSANQPFYRKNGKITTQIRLACALRYFAGGSYLDIIMSHAVGKMDFYQSIWSVVHAMNKCSFLDFQFPSTLAECQSISTEFSLRSKVGFTNCIGCIDGLLIWLEKPSKDQCNEVGVDSRKFLCRQKGKFGLNLQGICDARQRVTYISIQHPASASDYLAFVTSALYGHLTNDETTIPNGYCLYRDNAYVNDTFMTMPYPMISSGPKDTYNFIIHRPGLISSALSEFWSTGGAYSRHHLVQRYPLSELMLWFVVFASCIISALIEEAQHHLNNMHMTI